MGAFIFKETSNCFWGHFRVDASESLYDGVKSDESYSWHVYCPCSHVEDVDIDSGTVNCSYDKVADKCMTTGGSLSGNAFQKCDSESRRKRSAATFMENGKSRLIFQYNRDHVRTVSLNSLLLLISL